MAQAWAEETARKLSRKSEPAAALRARWAALLRRVELRHYPGDRDHLGARSFRRVGYGVKKRAPLLPMRDHWARTALCIASESNHNANQS